MKEVKDIYEGAHLLPQFLFEVGIVDSEINGRLAVKTGMVKINGKAHENPDDSVEITLGDYVSFLNQIVFMTMTGFMKLEENMNPKQRINE